ncbi:hypothetical protein [Pseudomonas luteola]|uniref:hypothetical protein n=1 Tax=Pseudomonas luteola TaxID=47886 RepID=UPI00123B589A|nr:hypothetical protein [Pseudomonas luteola]QEU31443.1 hypothetical protein FOB45_27115 [Pseudomonas luteola]
MQTRRANGPIKRIPAAQIQQVGVDGKNAINAAIAQKIELEQQVEAAKTAAEVAAIVWPQDEVAA